MALELSPAQIKNIPSLVRSLGVAAFIAGVLLAYIDAQKSAARHIAMNARVAATQEIASFSRADSRPAGDEVALTVRIAPGSAEVLTYRHGLTQRSKVVVPLRAQDPLDKRIYGFAYGATGAPAVEALAGGQVFETREMLGLYEPNRRISRAFQRQMAAQGYDVAMPPVPLMVYDAPREVILAQPIRSPWRAVLFWLAGGLFVASYILRSEAVRIDAKQRRMDLVKASRARQREAAKKPPKIGGHLL